MQEAVKIVDDKHSRDEGSGRSCRDGVANMLDLLEWRHSGWAASHRSSSNEVKRVAAWLRRGKILLENLNQWPFEFESFRNEVTRWEAVYAELERTPKLQRLTPRITAYEKLFAAEAALHLCDEFRIKPTTTKGGAFCRLAAVLYGDKDADLQKQCSKVLKPDYRTFLARVAPNCA